TPVPPGRIEFPRAGIGTPASANPRTPVLWRGNVVYGDNRKFAIWAKVEITAACPRLVATIDLKPGASIEADQLREESASCFPGTGKAPLSIDAVAGRTLVRSI